MRILTASVLIEGAEREEGSVWACLVDAASEERTREQAAAARDLFLNDGVRLVGTILNDFDPVAEGKPDYYASYYQYGQQDAVEHAGAGA